MWKTTLYFCMVCVFCGVGSAGEAKQNSGTFESRSFDDVTLHIFTTTEGPGDITYILENKDTLVLFELPSIHHLSRQLKAYVDKLGKPVAAILVGYHVGGASYYPGIPIYAHKNAVDFIDSGAEMRVRKIVAAGNPDFDFDVIRPNNVVLSSGQTIGEIDFVFVTPTTSPIPGMNVIIPSINAYYQHVLGGASHPNLVSIDHIDAAIAELKQQAQGNFALMMDSHNGIEAPDAIERKIAYLEKLKDIRETSSNQEEFIKAVRDAYPLHKSENMLRATAKNLYK